MKKFLFILLLTVCLISAPSISTVFVDASTRHLSDVESHWAKKQIEQAIRDGWVEGYPDGTFRPNHYITRAEFVKLIARANHIHFGAGSTVGEFLTKPTLPQYFENVQNHWIWEQEWLQPALAWGLVVPSDYGKKGFKPNTNITRREISVMSVRAMGEVFETQNTNVNLPFSDAEKIQQWLKGYVNVVADAGIVKGYPDGSFGQGELATRAEAVVMVQRQLNYNRKGVDYGIKLEVFGGHDNKTNPTVITPKVPIQLVDQTIYVPLRSVFFDVSNWKNTWLPTKQTIYFSYAVDFGYTAGSNVFSFYGSKGGDLLQPVRILNGELMLPVYHLEKGGLEPNIFHFDSTWDNERQTIQVKPLYVQPPLS